MKLQDRYSVEIVDMGAEGDGIGKAEGAAVFIPGAVIGDKVLVEITQAKKNYARGKIVQLEKPSPWRVKPACSYAGQCGGCPLAAMSYEGQLMLKKKWVTDKLKRIGGIEAPQVEDVIGMTDQDAVDMIACNFIRDKNCVDCDTTADQDAKKTKNIEMAQELENCAAGGNIAETESGVGGNAAETGSITGEKSAEAGSAPGEKSVEAGSVPGEKSEETGSVSGEKSEETGSTVAGNVNGASSDVAFIPIRYRNKAQFPVRAGRLAKNKEGKFRNTEPCSVGFYRAKSHDIVHCKTCLIQAEPAETIAAVVKRYVDENTVSVYDEKSHMGLLRHVIVRSAFATGEVMVVLVVNGDHLPKIETLVEQMDDAINAIPYPADQEQFWSLESVVLNVNKAKGSEVMGKECIPIAGKPGITDYLGELQFEISPRSFYQVNPVQMEKLYKKAVEFAHLTGEETVLDLYCGVGTIGLYCAKNARRVIGIESVRPAVMDANRNAVINGIVNAEYICGKAEEILPKRLSGIKADVVILDPPRSGCDKVLLESVLEVAPTRIVYVSCDPATLARDIKILGEGGYQLEKVQPVDMFPGTGHVETIVLIQRKTI